MRIKIILQFCLILFMIAIFMGCASSNFSKGHQALENEDFDTAFYFLKSAIKENVSNTAAIRDMGITLYYQGRVKLASRFLEKALERKPSDPTTLIFLGCSYEKIGAVQKAIDTYRQYTQVSPLSGLRKTIEGRLEFLLKKQMQIETRAMLVQEQSIDVSAIPDNAIAVLYFDNVTGKDALGPLSKGLTDMLITDLSQSHELSVVERARLQSLLDEMALGQTGVVDVNTAPRLGKLLGASKFVQGTILNIGNNSLRIDAGLSSTKAAQVIGVDKVSGELVSFMKMEKDLAFRIFDLLGVRLSPEEREAVQKLPTENILAFMQYCRGLDYEDRGMVRNAQHAFASAVKADPNFNKAQTAVNRVDAMSTVGAGIPNIKPKKLIKQQHKPSPRQKGKRAKPSMHSPVPGVGLAKGVMPGTSGRLFQTAQNVNPGFMPGIESRKPTTEENTPTFGNSVPIAVRIPLPRKP